MIIVIIVILQGQVSKGLMSSLYEDKAGFRPLLQYNNKSEVDECRHVWSQRHCQVNYFGMQRRKHFKCRLTPPLFLECRAIDALESKYVRKKEEEKMPDRGKTDPSFWI